VLCSDRTSISVANERYLKYLVEIILKLKFLIYRTYSDRYNMDISHGADTHFGNGARSIAFRFKLLFIKY
jgi:hypothetical protein